MYHFAEAPGFITFAVCSMVLVLKMWAVGVATATARSRSGVRVNSEDAGGGEVMGAAEPEPVARANRAHRNDLENIPSFWVVGLLAVLSQANGTALAACSIVFTAARVMHSFFYLRRVSKLRSVAWSLGVLSTLVLMGFTVAAWVR